MDFEEFYKKYVRKKSEDFENLYKFSLEGYEIMEKSRDFIHDKVHIDNLFMLLDEFLENQNEVKNRLDLKILVLAICWHDTWKATIDPKSIFAMVYAQATEGVRSYLVFHKKAKKYNLNTKLIKDTGYVIRKHSSFQIFPTKSIEAKVLQDIDKLESISLDRFLRAFKNNPHLNKKSRFHLAKFYVSRFSRNDCYFEWSKKLFAGRRREFLEKFEKVK